MITRYDQSSRRQWKHTWRRLPRNFYLAAANRRSLVHVLILAGALLWAVRLIQQGELLTLAWLAGGAAFLALSYRWPMPAVFALIVLSTNTFQFVDMAHLPYWQMAAGLRLTMLDSLLLGMFVLSVIKLNQRRERPLFLKPMLLLGGMVILSILIGAALGTFDLDNGMNLFRPMFSYTVYFIFIASVDSRKRLHTLVGILFLIMAVSVGLQIVEAIKGERLISATRWIEVEGQRVPYLHNRATGYLYIGLFLALGPLFSGIRVKSFLMLVLLGMLGFMIAMVRQWYSFIIAGIIVLFAIQKGRRFRTAAAIALVALGLLGIFAVVGSFAQATFGGSPLALWAQRVQTLFYYRQESTFVGRAIALQEQWNHFLGSPITGYGLSRTTLNLRDTDTGVINTLVQFGLMGLTVIAILIMSVLRQGHRLWQRLEPSLERGYVGGILGLWVGMLIGYSFSMDFFTAGGFMAALPMATLDRIHLFAYQEV